MHIKKNLGIYIAALVGFTVTFTVTFLLMRHSPVATAIRTRIIVYDHCQYLVFETGQPGKSGYSFSITHKGNCTNSVHRNP